MTFKELVELFRQKVHEKTQNKELTLYAIGSTLFEGGMMPLNRVVKGKGLPRYDTVEKWFNEIGYDVHIVITPKNDSEVKELSDRLNREAMDRLFDQITNMTTTVRRGGRIGRMIEDIVEQMAKQQSSE